MVRLSVTGALLLGSQLPRASVAKNHGHKTDKNGPYEHILTPRPHENPENLAALPVSWDWRDVDGVDYTARVQNQHQPGPTYCGACWAFATTGHLNARFNIAQGPHFSSAQLNVQALITCGPALNNGCGGSDPGIALKFIHEYGLPHESCHTYQGKNLECNAYNLCQDCMTDFTPVCWARNKFAVYHIGEYGTIRPRGDVSAKDPVERQTVIDDMVQRMKAELWKRGPIVCQIACPDPATASGIPVPTLAEVKEEALGKLKYGSIRGYMDDYTPYYNIAGENFAPFILNDTDFKCESGDWDNCVDHDITVVGWGEERGTKYWLIQNSWGDWWGEGGFFRIVMGTNNLGIESACFFGVPDTSGITKDVTGYTHLPQGTSEMFAKRFSEAAALPKQGEASEKVLFA